MIVNLASDAGLSLVEPDNFKAFKLQLVGYGPAEQPGHDGIRYIEDDHALISQDLVIALSGAPAGSEWRAGFDAMVKAAAKYGWIDAETQAIKAHVERA